MRTTLRFLGAALAVVLLAPSASAAQVTDLAAAVGEDFAVTLTGTADHDGLSAEPASVFTDPVYDIVAGGDDALLSFPFTDVVEGSIGETADTLSFTWRVNDIMDPIGTLPQGAVYYWDFKIGDEGFSMRARPSGTGVMEGNCTLTGNLYQCEEIPEVSVTVTTSVPDDTVTATLQKAELKDYSQGGENVVAVDGAQIVDDTANFAGGAATCFGIGVISGNLCDHAASNIYVIGTHVQGALVPADTDPESYELFFDGTSVDAPDGTGAFEILLEGIPGEHVALARPCVGGTCGPIAATDPFTI